MFDRIRNADRRLWWAAAVVLWGTALVVGMALLTTYGVTAGPPAAPPTQWPADSPIGRSPTLPTLLLFVHPRCPCSRATLDELARLAAQCQGRFQGHVLLAKPPGVGADWDQTEFRDTASAIPGVVVSTDDDEREARRFGATTSGYALLYAPDGRLLFSGGLTRARGHSGDNVGRSAVTALLRRQPADVAETPVFGCPLYSTTQFLREVPSQCRP